jgi:hypothetical protein
MTVCILWFTMIACAHAENTGKEFNADQAFARVKNRIATGSLRNYNVFIAGEPLPGGFSIPTRGKSIKVPSRYDKAWFIFVDDQPDTKWKHACRYFFVSVETGRFSVTPAKTPPDNWSEMKKIHSSGKPR